MVLLPLRQLEVVPICLAARNAISVSLRSANRTRCVSACVCPGCCLGPLRPPPGRWYTRCAGGDTLCCGCGFETVSGYAC